MNRIKKIINFSLKSKTPHILFIQIIISALISLISLYLFLKIGHEILENNILLLDYSITNFIYNFRNPTLTTIMLFFTSLGSGLALFSLSLIMILYLSSIRKKDVLIYLSILYSGVVINLLLKLFFLRPRPDNFPLIHENGLSFPSGHAMNSFVFFAAFSYFILRETKNVKLTIIISFISIIIILFIGISRIYLGVHYPSDVVGGFIAGFLWFLSAILFEKTIIFERLYKLSKK